MKQHSNNFSLAAIVFLTFFIPRIAKGQTKDNVELSYFYTQNIQAEYKAQYGSVSYTNDLKLAGPSQGIYIDYKRLLEKNTFIKVGLGYSVFGVNDIQNQTVIGGSTVHSNSRPINYPSSIFLFYSTNKYYYYDLLFHFALERKFRITDDLFLFIEGNYFHAYNLSQKYFIDKTQSYYHTSDKGNFGDFLNLNLGCSIKSGKLTLSPAFVLPIYKSWGQDVVFGENQNGRINSWFGGYGISLSLSYR